MVEAIVSLFVLSFIALALVKALTFSKYTAEDNLYEATALTVAVSAIEQMKGISLAELKDPPEVAGKPIFEMSVEAGASAELFLDEFNRIDVPIVTESDGLASKRLPLEVRPSISPMTTGQGYWLELRYRYRHPRTEALRERIIRNARSVVPSA